jgi:hypothetical protein
MLLNKRLHPSYVNGKIISESRGLEKILSSKTAVFYRSGQFTTLSTAATGRTTTNVKVIPLFYFKAL